MMLSTPFLSAQFYNGMNQDFGKNRVQYKDFEWSFYKYQDYNVYYYRGGKELAEFAASAADKHLKEIEAFFDYNFNGRFDFIVYNNQSDFYQSNIGNQVDQRNIGGTTRLVGTKIFLYFDGNHDHFEKSIREGVASLVVDQMMYGGDLKEVVKNSTLLTLPSWFRDGLVSFLAYGNDPIIQSKINDGFKNNLFKRFNSLEGERAIIAGHSIWSYIVDNYGLTVVPNILYMSKVSRNVESGLLFVIGISINNLSIDWTDYYQRKLERKNKTYDVITGDEILKKSKKGRVYYQFEISPDGNKIAYVTNELQQYKLWIYDLESGETKKIDRENFKLDIAADVSVPLLEWHPSGKHLSIIRERKGTFIWQLYSLEDKEMTESELFHFDKIMDYEYSDDGQYFVFSAVQKGKTDIYLYKVQGRSFVKITNDYFDDLEPVFIDNSSKILFSSNRINDTLDIGGKENISYDYNYDLFLYDIEEKSDVLRRITNTKKINERNPQKYDSDRFTYLSDKGGYINSFVGEFDSVLTHVDTIAHYSYSANVNALTNYSSSLFEVSFSAKLGKHIEVHYKDGSYYPLLKNTIAFDSLSHKMIFNSFSNNSKLINDTLLEPFYIVPMIPLDSGLIDINNYQFIVDSSETKSFKESTISVFSITDENGKSETKMLDTSDKTKEDPRKKYKRHLFTSARNYDVAFQANYVVTQLDNAFLNPMYQRYTGGAFYPNPRFNSFFKVGTSDVLEDYKITGGMRLGDLTNNEFFASLETLKKRWDKNVIYHRQVQTKPPREGLIERLVSQELTYKWNFPFSMTQRIGFIPSVRYDKYIYLSDNFKGLNEENTYDYWGRLKLEYVFDNVRNRGLNLYHGTRMKMFAESFYQIDEKDKNMVVFGIDARNYVKIHRQIIWANRFAASTSLGSQRLLYYLGGVDNWLTPKFNSNMQVGQNQNYVFQSIATNLRGFKQNIRNGNSFAVLNSEIRWPIVRYFVNKPLKSDFLENLQVIGFGDVGTAWTGSNPYSKDNSLNIEVIGSSPIEVTIQSQKEPFVGGYGFGIRSRMWGYFIRADWAWGVEDGQVGESQFYLSLNLDF